MDWDSRWFRVIREKVVREIEDQNSIEKFKEDEIQVIAKFVAENDWWIEHLGYQIEEELEEWESLESNGIWRKNELLMDAFEVLINEFVSVYLKRVGLDMKKEDVRKVSVEVARNDFLNEALERMIQEEVEIELKKKGWF